jgi:acyl-CoA oxidase
MGAPLDGDIVTLLAGPLLDPAGPDGDQAGLAAPYLGVRRLHDGLGGAGPLLDDHHKLRAVLELSAVRDPRLFHAMFLHHCMTVGPALDHGADAADVAALTSVQWIGAPLMNEAGHGNSSFAIRTEARYDPAAGQFILNTPAPEAAKYPASVGLDGIPRLGLVSARLLAGGTDHGTALFLVPLRDENGPCPGVTIEPRRPAPMLAMDFAAVRFGQVRVPRRRWLSDGASIAADGSCHDPLWPGSRTRRSLSIARFAWGAVSAALAAVARASVALALGYARRPTFDRLAGELPAIGHLNQQRLLVTAAAAALAATAVARRATGPAWRIPPGGGQGAGPSGRVLRELALAKVTADVLADQAVARCRSASGTRGFFAEGRLMDYQGLTLAFGFAGGDNRLLLLDGAWAMATGQDYCPPGDGGARDPWSRLLRARERLLHAELTAGLTAADAAIPFESWNDRTELAQRLAEAHAARVTAEIAFEDWTGPAVGDDAHPLLADLYQLYCLEQALPHAGWYLAHGLLTAREVLAMPQRCNDICRRVAAQAGPLAELMDIPGALLHGPPGAAG